MSEHQPYHLFEVFGVELEYMIVRSDRLSVFPITDKVLYQAAGDHVSEIELGEISWSNELVLHVIELKTTEPVPALPPLVTQFQEHVTRVNKLLAPLGGRLMPTAMHPWMDPHEEMRLWPWGYSPIYEAFHRIFDCRGHGWANLQSVHLNLPFCGDDEFGRLHAAIRVLLPIMPALAASSPIFEGRFSSQLDTRLDVYRTNARRIPSVSGQVIPEAVFTPQDYQSQILDRIYADIAPHDPEGILQFEWLNARGAIARFDRSAIEIRVLDVQECPLADLAICAAIGKVLRGLVEEQTSSLASQQAFDSAELIDLLAATVRDADEAPITDPDYLTLFDYPVGKPQTAGHLWRHLIEDAFGRDPGFAQAWQMPLEVILAEGPLARRILQALAGDTSAVRMAAVYEQLSDCLAEGRMFTARA